MSSQVERGTAREMVHTIAFRAGVLERILQEPVLGSLEIRADELAHVQLLQRQIDDLRRYLNLPSAEPEIIRCQDCKWWDRLEEGHPYGYCRACRSGTHTERWEISIYRQNRYDFFCADAEPKEEEDDDE